MHTTMLRLVTTVCLLAPACADNDPDALADPDDAAQANQTARAERHQETPRTAASADEDPAAPAPALPAAIMPSARDGFDEVRALIEAHYVDGALTEDELWTAAIDGVMARLIQQGEHPVNALLRPDDLAELKIGTQGRLVGIGVVIERVADVVVLRGVVPDSPAARAGLQAGDRILGIDGERLKGKSLAQVVEGIRGDEGTMVDLFVQRDTEEWTATLPRTSITVSNVESRMLEGDIGFLRVRGFAANTMAEFDAAMQALSDAGMRRLVLDLRNCPGGLLDSALSMTERFLPPGKRIVTVRGRQGAEEHIDAETTDPWETLPMVILVDHHTASGAEILAEACRHHDRARLVGEPTFGKGTVESIHDLADGWALKLSVRRFVSPSGEARSGAGVQPDLQIPGPDEASRVAIDDLDARSDPQLRAALELLGD